MKCSSVCVVGIFLAAQFRLLSGATISEAESLHVKLFLNYNKNIRPIYNQSLAMYVGIVLYIKSIQEFDEVTEKFSFVAALQLHWHDYRMMWDTSDYGGLDQITVSYDDVWIPELTLSSPSAKAAALGKSSDIVRLTNEGYAQWMPANLIESTCSVDVRNYPFDTQSCTTSFSSLGYKNNEVNLVALIPTIGFNVFSPNAMWDVVGSEVKTLLLGSGGESEILFTLNIKRKSAFVVINVLIPILVLGLLNILVFVLVPESGERIGFCITTLLAIAVYMTIVNDMLPRTSEPVPLISYKLMIDMVLSALIVLVTILNLRLYHKDDTSPVPNWIKSVYRLLSCAPCRSRKVSKDEVTYFKSRILSISNGGVRTNAKGKERTTEFVGDQKSKQSDAPINAEEFPVTWKQVSYMVDWLALALFTMTSLTSFLVFIAIAKSG